MVGQTALVLRPFRGLLSSMDTTTIHGNVDVFVAGLAQVQPLHPWMSPSIHQTECTFYKRSFTDEDVKDSYQHHLPRVAFRLLVVVLLVSATQRGSVAIQLNQREAVKELLVWIASDMELEDYHCGGQIIFPVQMHSPKRLQKISSTDQVHVII